MTYKELRKKYKEFCFESYSYKIENELFLINFVFKTGEDFIFNHKISIQIPSYFKNANYDNLVFNIGLIEMISYWKATCSPIIRVKAGKLEKKQIKFFYDLIINGMGEYFYKNKINFKEKDFVKIISDSKILQEKMSYNCKNELLIGIGGGKDSIVSIELLKELNPTGFIVNNYASKKIAEFSGLPFVTVQREFDSQLKDLNNKGFLNGHTPFSSFIAFLGILLGALWQKKYIVVSNERSADEGNTLYLGKKINHQYSKTLDFENKFRKYCNEFLTENIQYFSFLRPWHEIQIAKKFSQMEKYHDKFLSCNIGQANKTNKWCGNCAKCLFVFMMLYPFLGKQKIEKIFSKDLFEDKKLLPDFKALLGVTKTKPFDCVGTKKEAIVAMSLSLKGGDIKNIPYLLKYFKNNFKVLNDKNINNLLSDFQSKNNVPKDLLKYLK